MFQTHLVESWLFAGTAAAPTAPIVSAPSPPSLSLSLSRKRKRSPLRSLEPNVPAMSTSTPPPKRQALVDLNAHETPLATPPPKFLPIDVHVTPTPAAYAAAIASSDRPATSARDYDAYSAGSRSNKSNQSAQSNQSNKRKRTASPTKKMGDLRLSDANVKYVELRRDLGPLSESTRLLWKEIAACASGRESVPAAIEAEFTAQAGEGYFFESGHFRKPSEDDPPVEMLRFQLHRAVEILEESDSCSQDEATEAQWNGAVHHGMLHLALKGYEDVGFMNITTAKIHPPSLAPSEVDGPGLERKMVDFCLFLDPKAEDVETAIEDRLARQPQGLRSLNQTNLDCLRHRPIAVSIETKTPNSSTSTEDARVQLSVWASAQFNRLRLLCPHADIIDLPLVYVNGESWEMLIAHVSSSGRVTLYGKIKLGGTDSLHGIYKLIRALQRLARWVQTDFQSWLVDNVLRDFGSI